MAACAPHGRYYFPAEFFTYVGYLLTCPLGVYMAGRIAKQRGPFWPTFAGAHLAFEAMLAEMVVLSAIIYLGPLARETFTIIPFVAAPLIGALIGFNANYTKPITGCTLTALRKPPLRLGRIAAQIVVGPIVGAIGAIGFFVAARSAQAHTIIDFMQVGYLVACPCCIYLVGRSRG